MFVNIDKRNGQESKAETRARKESPEKKEKQLWNKLAALDIRDSKDKAKAAAAKNAAHENEMKAKQKAAGKVANKRGKIRLNGLLDISHLRVFLNFNGLLFIQLGHSATTEGEQARLGMDRTNTLIRY